MIMESEKKSFYGGYIMKQTDKIGFEDIFDLTDIEKNFEQTLEFDILQLMEKWENERKEREEHKTSLFIPISKRRARLIHWENSKKSFTRRTTTNGTRTRAFWGKFLSRVRKSRCGKKLSYLYFQCEQTLW